MRVLRLPNMGGKSIYSTQDGQNKTVDYENNLWRKDRKAGEKRNKEVNRNLIIGIYDEEKALRL